MANTAFSLDTSAVSKSPSSNQILQPTADVTGLTIKGKASGTADIWTEFNSAATPVLKNGLLSTAQPYSAFSYPSAQKVRNLRITVASTTTLSISYDEAILYDGTYYRPFYSLGTTTLNTATTGANALDAGTLAASTLYAVWLIAKSDGTQATLASLSFTAPAMPTGYGLKLLVSQFYTNGSSQINAYCQLDRHWMLDEGLTSAVMRLVSAATPANTNWVTMNASSFVSSTWGAIPLIVEGFLGGAITAGTQIYLTVISGGSIVGNTLHGQVISQRTIYATTPQVTVVLVNRASYLTDGTVNQQGKYKVSAYDANNQVTIDLIGMILPI